MFERGTDIGLDLGTASVLIYIKGQGIVLREPSVVAVDDYNGEVIAVGEEAREMIGRTPKNIKVIRPLKRGVISDYEATEKMLKCFIHKAIGNRLIKPRITVCVPSGVTEVEKKAVEDVTRQAGARRVDIIEEPIAAAIGAGIDIGKPCGSMVVDIGGGTTDIAVVSLGGGVVEKSLKIAGNNFDDAIIKYVRKKHGILIGESTAEEIKMTIGTVYPREVEVEMNARGRNIITGLPKSFVLTSDEITEVLREPIASIIDAVHKVLELTPLELAGDIFDRGMVLTGGGSLIYGLDKLIYERTKINAVIADEAVSCVAVGTGLFVERTYNKKRR